MLGSLKINTAILICSAFLFRLLFVNIGFISSLTTPQNKSFIKSQFSSSQKRRKNADILSNSNVKVYSIIEICEENSNDEENFSKANPFIFIQFLYSFFANKIASSKSNALFDFLNCNLSPRKYLTISVLRI